MPATRLASLDDFVKWIFTSITVVGLLAAGFSTSAIKEFSTGGSVCFFVAIGLTGSALFLAVLARAVEPSVANQASLQDMLKADLAALDSKRKRARAAGLVFAVAILAAGAAPLISLVSRGPAHIENGFYYSLGKDGIRITANLTLPSQKVSQIKVLAEQASLVTVVASAQSRADSNGIVKLETTGSIPANSTSLRVILACDVASGKAQTFDIPLAQKTNPEAPDQIMTPTCLK